MRRTFLLAILASICFASGARAQEGHGAVQGFGGLRVGSAGSGSADTAFGGTIVGSLTPNIQVVGEVGRLSSVLPSSFDLLFGLSPIDAGVAAWYGEGGVRFTSRPAGFRPYVETSAGIARLHAGVGLSGGRFAPLANVALNMLNRTSPIATVGGGVSVEAGHVVVDAGYRFHRLFANDWLQALTIGQDLDVSEVRFGIGVRF